MWTNYNPNYATQQMSQQMYQQPNQQMNGYPQSQQTQQIQQTPTQIQNCGFILIPSEDFVERYPVAPGNCVTFKIEGQPIVMEKSMGFSQFEPPRIKRYKLVEELPQEPAKAEPAKAESNSISLDDVWSEINALKEKINAMEIKGKSEVVTDDAE